MVTFTSADLDNAVSESGVVHESVANTDHDNASRLQQGYSASSPLFSASTEIYSPLNEDSGTTAYDFSGNARNGTYSGVTLNQSGILNTTAPSGDGTDDELSYGYGRNYPVTLLCYTNPTSLPSSSGGQFLFATGFNFSNDFGVALKAGTSDFQVFIGDSFATAGSGLSNGVWQQVALVVDASGNYDVVVDASVDGSGAATNAGANNETYVWNGAAGEPSYYPGQIGYFQLLNTNLSTSQLQTHRDVVTSSGTLTTKYKPV